MSEKHDGGPAFRGFVPAYKGDRVREHDGMTLRDWFAGQALIGITQYQSDSEGDFLHSDGPKGAARWAYRFADAMIAERSK